MLEGEFTVSTNRFQSEKLFNTWAEPVTVVLNNRTYRLVPGERRIESVLAGTFTYEVLNVTAPNNVRTVAPGETYVIHVHPQL